VLGEEVRVELLELVAQPGIIDVDQVVMEDPDLAPRQDPFLAPDLLDSWRRQLFIEELPVLGTGFRVRAEVGQDLAESRLPPLGTVKGPEDPVRIVETVLPTQHFPGWKVQWSVEVSHSPYK
jgi:hypothetical protein